MAAGGLLGSSWRKKKPNQRRRTPTVEAARVVQGGSIKLRGWKQHAREKETAREGEGEGERERERSRPRDDT